MKRLFITVGVVGMFAAVMVSNALAAATFPTSAVEDAVDSYGTSLLTALVAAFTVVWPYAAVVTGVAIVAGMIRRWLGSRRATGV